MECKMMDGFRNNYSEVGYALFRVFAGVLFMLHGLQKFGVLDGGFKFPSGMMLVAGTIELLGGLLIALGLLTWIAAFLSSGLMAFAYWMAHGTKAFLPTANGGELAVLYCFAFLYIFFQGGGKYSLDTIWCGACGKKAEDKKKQ